MIPDETAYTRRWARWARDRVPKALQDADRRRIEIEQRCVDQWKTTNAAREKAK